MVAFNKETSAKAIEAQRKKYPDYSKEMRRRGALTKKRSGGGFKWIKEHDPQRFAKIIAEREFRRREFGNVKSKKTTGGENNPQSQDNPQG